MYRSICQKKTLYSHTKSCRVSAELSAGSLLAVRRIIKLITVPKFCMYFALVTFKNLKMIAYVDHSVSPMAGGFLDIPDMGSQLRILCDVNGFI